MMLHVDINDLADRNGVGTLPDGTLVSADALRRIGCSASVARIVTKGGSEVLDLGRQLRLPSPAVRRAVRARDHHCQFPGCRVKPEWCQIHHVVHWGDGGETTITNLVLVCHHHHHLLHEGGWTASMGPDQKLQVFRPPGEPMHVHRLFAARADEPDEPDMPDAA